MFTKANILNTHKISIQDFIEIAEKYHASGNRIKLSEKLSDQAFKAHLKANPLLLAINREID